MALMFNSLPPTLKNVILISTMTGIECDVWIPKLVLEQWSEVWEEGELIGFMNEKMEVIARRAYVSGGGAEREADGGDLVLPDKPPTLFERFKRVVARMGKRHSSEIGSPSVGIDGVERAGTNGVGVAIHD